MHACLASKQEVPFFFSLPFFPWHTLLSEAAPFWRRHLRNGGTGKRERERERLLGMDCIFGLASSKQGFFKKKYTYSTIILLNTHSQPTTVACKMEAQSEHVHVACTFLHVCAPICVLSRCVLTKFLRRSSGRSLLRVRCWLGSRGGREREMLELMPG